MITQAVTGSAMATDRLSLVATAVCPGLSVTSHGGDAARRRMIIHELQLFRERIIYADLATLPNLLMYVHWKRKGIGAT